MPFLGGFFMKKYTMISLLLIIPMVVMSKAKVKIAPKAKLIKIDKKQLIDKTDELFKAVEKGKTSTAKSLLKSKSYKIEINRLNKNKNTVLDIAVDNQYTKLASILLKHGAKVTTQAKAYELQRMFELRATKFFLGGLLLWPLWFGSAFACNNIKSINELVL